MWSRGVGLLVLFAVVSTAVASAGPRLVVLMQAVVPLIVAVGLVIVVVRLVWHYTNRY
jgi:hypothetical protein